MRALVFLCCIHIRLMFKLYFELGLFGRFLTFPYERKNSPFFPFPPMFQIRDQERVNDASSWLEYYQTFVKFIPVISKSM